MNLYIILDYRPTWSRVRLITDDLHHALVEMGEEKSELREGSTLVKIEAEVLDPRLFIKR